jgi:P-type Ca2+ transporter type 2C
LCNSHVVNDDTGKPRIQPLNASEKETITNVSSNKNGDLRREYLLPQIIDEYSSAALRVLAVAYKTFENSPSDDSETATECDLVFIGLFASIDPERKEVYPATSGIISQFPKVLPAIAAAHDASVRVCMITGDYIKTAKAIAINIGLIPRGSPSNAALDCEIIREIGNRIELLETQIKAKETPGNELLRMQDGNVHESVY